MPYYFSIYVKEMKRHWGWLKYFSKYVWIRVRTIFQFYLYWICWNTSQLHLWINYRSFKRCSNWLRLFITSSQYTSANRKNLKFNFCASLSHSKRIMAPAVLLFSLLQKRITGIQFFLIYSYDILMFAMPLEKLINLE